MTLLKAMVFNASNSVTPKMCVCTLAYTRAISKLGPACGCYYNQINGLFTHYESCTRQTLIWRWANNQMVF